MVRTRLRQEWRQSAQLTFWMYEMGRDVLPSERGASLEGKLWLTPFQGSAMPVDAPWMLASPERALARFAYDAEMASDLDKLWTELA